MIKAVRGVRDILPSETPRWQRVEGAARRVFEAYGYREIRVPLFIKEGEKVKVHTETREFAGRA